MLKRLLLLVLGLVLFTAGRANAQDSVYFDIRTSTGTDTFYVGVPSSLIFDFDPRGNVSLSLGFPLAFSYTSDQIFGVLQYSNVVSTTEADTIFELDHAVILKWWDGVSADSMLLNYIDGGGDHWLDSAEVWRLRFVPQSTGAFHFDSVELPAGNHWDALADYYPYPPLPSRIINYGHQYVVKFLNGDLNSDGLITSVDILYSVRYCFKGGPPPVLCTGIGDVDCSGAVTSTDVIYLVAYVFKGGPPPCDIETLIPGTWSCP